MSNLKKNILSGFIWTAFQTVGIKVFSLVSQLVLAWILLPEDFGKIGLMYAITSFALLIQNFGLSDVLVSNGNKIKTLLPLAQTISCIAGIICFLFTLIFGYIGSVIYNDSELFILVLIFSITTPFNALSVVADAKLRIELRFKELSIVKVFIVFLTQTLIILFAYTSFGVYSFVMAPVITSLIRYFILFYLAEITYFFKFTTTNWRGVVSNSSWGFLHAIAQKFILQSDYLILGLFASQAIVGVYFMAYSLSVQAIGLLVGTLTPVLFPTLLKIPKENLNQIRTVLISITQLFAMVGMPFALWQVTTSKLLITIFLDKKWVDTIPLVQILSIGMGFYIVSSLWALSLRLQSRFKLQAIYSLTGSVVFLSLLLPLTYFFNVIGTAITVAIYHIVVGPTLVYFSFSNYQIKLKEILLPLIKYFVLSLFIFGSLFYISETYITYIYINLIFNGLLAPIIYFGLLYKYDTMFKTIIIKIPFVKNIIDKLSLK